VETVAKVLTGVVLEACEKLGHGGVLQEVEPAIPTSDPQFGDYQSNHAFRLGKALKQNPRAVAEAVRQAIPAHPAIASITVAGPGFLNFRLNEAWLAEQTSELAADAHRGIVQTGAGKTVVVDYSAPNVAKRMHIGHMRSTFIGSALYRLYAAAGWRTIGDNHIGDWGTQFGKLIVAWRLWLVRDAYDKDPIGELERLYVKFADEATPELEDAARAETAKLQSGDPENTALWKQFIAVSMAEFNKVYERLGVKFDVVLGESAYNDALSGIVRDLVAANIAVVSDGATVVKFGAEAGSGLADTVLVIQKKDGAYLYGTSDLATIRAPGPHVESRQDRLRRRHAAAAALPAGVPHVAPLAAARARHGALLVRVPEVRRLDHGVPRREHRPVRRSARRGAAPRPCGGRREVRRASRSGARGDRRGGGHERRALRRPVAEPAIGRHVRLGPHAVARRQHRAVPLVRLRALPEHPTEGRG
jgi:hypothetical protein